jgi:hypothetical protein
MAIIRNRDLDLERLYDELEETEVDSPAHRKLLDLILRKQVQTAMRSADAAETSAKAATRASLAAMAGAIAAWLTVLAALFKWLF